MRTQSNAPNAHRQNSAATVSSTGSMVRRACSAAVVFCTGLFTQAAAAHEVRPGYLELVETTPNQIQVVWKQPLRADDSPGVAGLRLRIEPRFPATCDARMSQPPQLLTGAVVERFFLDCSSSIVGQTVGISGLERTLTDVLLRVELLDGTVISHLLRPQTPAFEIGSDQGSPAFAYLRLGVEHLIFGYDHILFVIGVLFLVSGALQLLKVITSFTVAHSITLALSSLGLVTLPPAPVEAVIALSLVFLASELMKPPERRSPLTTRHPWLMAFGFGLLHGFGFAGALAEIGLPKGAAALALLLFNLGVEIGQLLIVALVLALVRVVRATAWEPPRIAERLPILAMGVLSAYWLIERVWGFAD